jgi:hypothetical protein
MYSCGFTEGRNLQEYKMTVHPHVLYVQYFIDVHVVLQFC